jgi:uncharacterized protein with GYD domain
MAKYLIEETIATQTFAGMLKQPEDRFEALKPIFKAAGCRLEQGYSSGIENKAYMVVESPDLNSVYTVGVNFMASGAATAIKYIPLMTLSEAADMCRKAAGLAYRPPGK